MNDPSTRRRLSASEWPAAVYAIGDVHGCHRQLAALERMVVADGAELPGEKWIVTLGDHIDRGPDSRAVLDHLLAPPPEGFRRFSLLGNHEQMMLDFLADPEEHAYWLDQGGIETLASYGVDVLRPYATDRVLDAFLADLAAAIPPAHLEWIAGLPVLLELPGWLFVHAGVRPGVPVAQQTDEDLVWIREPFLSGPGLRGCRVVHGHTPGRMPVVTESRIGIDTHCFVTGRLTALRVTPDGVTRLLST